MCIDYKKTKDSDYRILASFVIAMFTLELCKNEEILNWTLKSYCQNFLNFSGEYKQI
jgi:hypothetical protein